MSQFSIPCIVYRGGTSRGLFFHSKDLPDDNEQQRKIFLAGIDAYNPSQVNGLGSGTSHTSKVAVISPPSIEGVDVDYTFYQIGIGEEVVSDAGTCGNLMAAVGAFAVDEGLTEVDPSADYAEVSVFDTNIKKKLLLKVPVTSGKAKVSGNYLMPGLVKPGAKFSVNIQNPGGGKTGKTLPLGARQRIKTKTSTYEVSFLDIVNPFVFVSSHALGIKGTELNSELATNIQLLEELESIRSEIAVQAGMANNVQEARLAPAVPKVAIVSEPHDYTTSSGELIKGEEVNIVAKMLSMGRFHRTFAVSGLFNIAAATLLTDTIPNGLSKKTDGSKEQLIRIGHPEGIAEVRVGLTEDRQDVAFVGLDRTARKIMKGELFIPRHE